MILVTWLWAACMLVYFGLTTAGLSVTSALCFTIAVCMLSILHGGLRD